MLASQAEFKVVSMCRVFDLAAGAYYRWRRRFLATEESRLARERKVLQRLRALFVASHRTYGVDRLTCALKREDATVSRRLVHRLMKTHGIRAVTHRRRWTGTVSSGRSHGIADRLERDFSTVGPRRKAVADATVIPTRNGPVYLAIVLDAHSRKVIGWEVSTTQNAALMCRALVRAARRGSCRGMIHHSDQGVQYASSRFQRLCASLGIRQSMGSVGDCYDNAMAESFFATLKREWVRFRSYGSVAEVRESLREYIDGFYNSRRMHSSIGYAIPNEFERKNAEQPGLGHAPSLAGCI